MSWITIKPQIEGSGPFTTCYYSSLAEHESRGDAISAGFAEYGCDDFLVGEIEGDAEERRLLRLCWMDQDKDDDERDYAAEQLALKAGPAFVYDPSEEEGLRPSDVAMLAAALADTDIHLKRTGAGFVATVHGVEWSPYGVLSELLEDLGKGTP